MAVFKAILNHPTKLDMAMYLVENNNFILDIGENDATRNLKPSFICQNITFMFNPSFESHGDNNDARLHKLFYVSTSENASFAISSLTNAHIFTLLYM